MSGRGCLAQPVVSELRPQHDRKQVGRRLRVRKCISLLCVDGSSSSSSELAVAVLRVDPFEL